MDVPEDEGSTFLKADEVDEPGQIPEEDLDSNSLTPNITSTIDIDRIEQQASPGSTTAQIRNNPTRPGLKRDVSVPAPLQPPPPPPQAQQVQEPSNPSDSLSLMQLRSLVKDMPKIEPTPYAFQYEDASSFAEEVEEWFGYGTEERAQLLKVQASFAHRWQTFNSTSTSTSTSTSEEFAYVDGKLDWRNSHSDVQRRFLEDVKKELVSSEDTSKTGSLESIVYLALGLWNETAGLKAEDGFNIHRHYYNSSPLNIEAKYAKSFVQIDLMRDSMRQIHDVVDIQTMFDLTRKYCSQTGTSRVSVQSDDISTDDTQSRQWCCLTILYFALELARQEADNKKDSYMKHALGQPPLHLKPQLLPYIYNLIATYRWADSSELPLSKLLLLFWKAILVVFGGLPELEELKSVVSSDQTSREETDLTTVITASPLDYHLFRQEITSNSILPPLQPGNKNGLALRQDPAAGGAGLDGTRTSILHQPVHIATPAPSPPPSPAGPGGKLGKKQNYQTNQNFPFLYPPLEGSSNDIGGKGNTEMLDLLVGRRWEGSDIPASILEAADLFAKRMRATRAMRQLWEERIRYMKYERGYDGIRSNGDLEVRDEGGKDGGARSDEETSHLDEESSRRLDAVESFYHTALPELQSIVIVLLKVLLTTVTNLVTQANVQGGLGTGFQSPDNQHQSSNGQTGVNETNGVTDRTSDSLLRDLDTIRWQEITGKAVSGILLLLLKWFKVSHILKFEYLNQLLLDSNYVQLILKLFTHQELERAVNYKCERKSLNFFQFCQTHSRHGNHVSSDNGDDEDDAVPPPINLYRQENNQMPTDGSSPTAPRHPEVDELRYSTSDIPVEPITDFSWRNFFSSINFLRIMQKICKNKAHRNLLMVQYKYSNILKRSLKVPQPEIRLYTLKIIKGQVPYCNRKWRQSNMRIITAIYLHCRPELRDDWLAGIDVDAEMMEALPQEQALRALTYWYNVKRYPDVMGVERGLLDREQDFFLKELDRMGEEAEMAAAAEGQFEEEQNDEGQWEGGMQIGGGWR